MVSFEGDVTLIQEMLALMQSMIEDLRAALAKPGKPAPAGVERR